MKKNESTATESLVREFRNLKEEVDLKEKRIKEIRDILMSVAITDGVDEQKPGKSGITTTWKCKVGDFFLEVIESFKQTFSKDKFFDLLSEALLDPKQLTFIPDEVHRMQLFEVLKLIKDKATSTSSDKKFQIK